MGVYLEAADAVKAVSPATELSSGLKLADPEATRYVIVQAAYDIEAAGEA